VRGGTASCYGTIIYAVFFLEDNFFKNGLCFVIVVDCKKANLKFFLHFFVNKCHRMMVSINVVMYDISTMPQLHTFSISFL
jgi:hypothetical protein